MKATSYLSNKDSKIFQIHLYFKSKDLDINTSVSISYYPYKITEENNPIEALSVRVYHPQHKAMGILLPPYKK